MMMLGVVQTRRMMMQAKFLFWASGLRCRTTPMTRVGVVHERVIMMRDSSFHPTACALSHRNSRRLALSGAQHHHASRMLFLPNRPRARTVTTATRRRYIDSIDHSDA